VVVEFWKEEVYGEEFVMRGRQGMACRSRLRAMHVQTKRPGSTLYLRTMRCEYRATLHDTASQYSGYDRRNDYTSSVGNLSCHVILRVFCPSTPMVSSKLVPSSSSGCYLDMTGEAASLLTLVGREEVVVGRGVYLYLVDEVKIGAQDG
jgi:hypothetical protein